ncbi:MAG: coenzyme F420-0:L-glutamate ligase [Anaerolineae bacterium]|nr:coenzyme F420-0:L-glutamate ligase [Anaerolineae bacterium]MDQ7036572.1 coenzyme F420-0:L-glutamate ligase [Anaerolineae bacterium]
MPQTPLQVFPVQAPVQTAPFALLDTLQEAMRANDIALRDGDILAVSSKYVAISEGRIVEISTIEPSDKARELAKRYNMDARIAELVVREADHIFGGIPMGYLLTWRSGIIAPNAGLDRSNIPDGKAVLLSTDPYQSARQIRDEIKARLGKAIGVILTDSWLVPGRIGTTGVALASAGFEPVQDERGKEDLFGNPMVVTQKGVADSLSVCAQMVMGERDEATPIAIIRGADVQMTDTPISQDDVSIPWELCIYVESLTLGLLPDGAPHESLSAKLGKRDIAGM